VTRGQIQWQSNEWATSCDGYITIVQTSFGNCGPICTSTPDCSHFPWKNVDGGTCFLKSGPVNQSDAVCPAATTIFCSLVTSKYTI